MIFLDLKMQTENLPRAMDHLAEMTEQCSPTIQRKSHPMCAVSH